MTSPLTEGLAEVHLRGFPLDVAAQASEHHAALTREFHLIGYGVDDERVDHRAVPVRLLRLVDDLTGTYAGLTDAQDAAREQALADGLTRIDLVYHVPASVREACLALGGMLDEADEFCRAGELLTLATPPALVQFRRWYLGEFVRQIDGEAPQAWDDYVAASVVVATGESPHTDA